MDIPVDALYQISYLYLEQLRWDEWVPEARLLKLNEAGFAKRRQLLEQQTKKNRPAGAASPASSSVKGKEKAKKAESGKKRTREVSTIENVRWFFRTVLMEGV